MNTPQILPQHDLRRYPDKGITFLEEKENYLRFRLFKTDISMANALRRTMISEIPTMAIDLIEIKENSSSLHDEFLAHRLGLVPLKCKDIESFLYSSECQCFGCPKCTAVFILRVENNTTQVMPVTSLNLISQNELIEPYHGGPECATLHDPPRILLAKLAPNQKINIKAVAKKGVGHEHAKWSSCTVSYQIEQQVIVNDTIMDSMSAEEKKAIVNKCHKGAIEYDEASGQIIVDSFKCEGCKSCEGESIKVIERGDSFIFTLEGTGALEVREILLQALMKLRSKLSKIEDIIVEGKIDK